MKINSVVRSEDVSNNDESIRPPNLICSEGLDLNFEQSCLSYSDTMGNCSSCLILAPHSQLFACLKEHCPFSLQQQLPVLSPSMFYSREKLFCGSCAFRGPHSPHKTFMREAEPLAFSTASGEVGFKLEENFNKFMNMEKDSPVEYFMKDLLKSRKLEKVRVTEFLEKSGTILEWHRRLSLLHDMLRTLNDFRADGHNFVREQAEKLLTTFSIVSKSVQKDCAVNNPERANIQLKRLNEHRRIMGEEHSDEVEYFPYSSMSSSRASILCSVTTSSTVLHNSSKRRFDQSRFLEEMDDEVTGGYAFDKKETHPVNEETVDEVLQECVKLSRRFHSISRYSSIDSAIHQIADFLDLEAISADKKRVVICNLEKELSIKWPHSIK